MKKLLFAGIVLPLICVCGKASVPTKDCPEDSVAREAGAPLRTPPGAGERGAVPRRLDVRAFGAVGDGVADDTAAFQRAADAAAVPADGDGGRMWMVTRHGQKAMSDSFAREIYVPPGRYLLKGPVVFDFNVTVRGDRAVVIPSAGGTAFFMQHALRVELDGLSFEGGAVHVRHWSANRDTATCLVRRCRFSGASQTAFVADAYREADGRKYASREEEMKAGALKRTCPAVVAERKDGRWTLAPRRPGSYEPMENSTNFIVDDCRFEGNACALDIRSDGCAVRRSTFVAPPGTSRPQLELGVRSHVNGSRFEFPRCNAAAMALCHSGNHTFDGCSFISASPLPVVWYADPPSPGYVASSLAVRDSSVENCGAEVVFVAQGAMPNSISLAGLKGRGQLFGFGRVPTAEELAEMLKGRRHPDLGPSLSYGVSVADTDGLTDNLPPVLEPFRHAVPPEVRRRCPDVAPEAGPPTSVRTLPDGYMPVSGTIQCRDGELVRAGGRCVLLAEGDEFPVFRVPSGARVRFENLTVHRGRTAISVEGDGRAEVVNCAFYDQAEETFAVPKGSLCVFGGMAYTPFLFRGAGRAFLDAFWFSALPDHGDAQYRDKSYAALSLGAGGELVVRDLLGVPCYFRMVQPMHDIWRVRPSPDQTGDFRWIDSHGDVACFDCRFGGEWGGLTPVYQHGAGTTYIEGPFFATDCPRLRSTSAVVRIDSAGEPVIADSVTTQYGRPFAARAYNTFPHRHDIEPRRGDAADVQTPVRVAVECPGVTNELARAGGSSWSGGGVRVVLERDGRVLLEAPGRPVCRVRLSWRVKVPRGSRLYVDAWERTEGVSGWHAADAFRFSPWFTMICRPDGVVDGYGVAVCPSSLVGWERGRDGLDAVFDVTSGGRPLRLGGRTLDMARLVFRRGFRGEGAFAAGRELCRMMCPRPRLPRTPVYGYNDWYCAYGKNTATNFLADASFICSLAEGLENRPFAVMDDGWQPNSPPVVKKFNVGASGWGPWDRAGEAFGMDMAEFAGRVRAIGARPGLWYRPYRAWEEAPASLRCRGNPAIFDVTRPEVVAGIREDIRRFREWGFELVKIDYLTKDLCGRYGADLGDRVFHGDCGWADDTRTSAEVILGLHRAMREAAGDDVVLIGCNALNHLVAGIFEVQRTGNDTSGWSWEQTRRVGVNTLGARAIQDRVFFAADADCVGLAKAGAVPWEKNSQWLDLVARSGTPLFVSWHRSLADEKVRSALAKAFATASRPRKTGEPLDWLDSLVPRRWRFADGDAAYDW